MEYEIKLLGKQKELSKIFNLFCTSSYAKRNRNYAFNTYYLDTVEGEFFKSGYSLRHRTGVAEIEKTSGTELKALSGAVGGVSARLEIEQLGSCPYSNYLCLKNSHDWPNDAPNLPAKNIKGIFSTSVRRMERQSYFTINKANVLIEAAFDDISYLKIFEQSPNLFDNFYMPVYSEYELEFELKTRCDLSDFFNWVNNNLIKNHNVKITTQSKALRAYNYIG